MPGISRVLPHPLRECDVVGEQPRVVAAPGEARGLHFRADVEQTHRDRVELVSRRCGDHLAGGDRIAGQQQMPAPAWSVSARCTTPSAACCRQAIVGTGGKLTT